VIYELFGLADEELRARMSRSADSSFRTTTTPEEVAAASAGMDAIMAALVASEREHPGDDLTSGLIAVRSEEDSALSERELCDTLALMLTAGHETTVNLLGNAVHALLTRPEQLAHVRAGRAADAPRRCTARTRTVSTSPGTS
jgi:cytochrome P450